MAFLPTTVRFRLTVAFMAWTCLMNVAVIGTIDVVRGALHVRDVSRRLESQLALLEQLASAPGSEVDDALNNETSPLAAREWDGRGVHYEVRDLDGELLLASDVAPETTLVVARDLQEWARQGRNAGGRMLRVPHPSADHPAHTFRAMAQYSMSDAGGGQTWVGVAVVSFEFIDRVGNTIRGVLIGMLLASTGIAGAAGWIVSRRLAERLSAVSAAVRDFSADQLHERPPLPTPDDEIGRMSAEINDMRERLAGAFRAQHRFLSDVSHELKTPVSALLAEAQMLRASFPDGETLSRFILGVEEEMRRLARVVEGFLQLARVGHGRQFLDQSLVSANEIAVESVEHATMFAAQAGVSLALSLYDAPETENDPVVRGDSELLRVALDNLVRNAIQFSQPGDAVNIRVWSDGGRVRFTVHDRGPGVPGESIHRIFERFEQVPTPRFGSRGTGLGLAIAKGVAEIHGGTITVKNNPEGGCTFTITLPAGARGAAAFAAPEPRA